MHQFISKSLRWRVKYFGIFNPWNNVYNGVRGGFLINVPIMLKDLLKFRDIANFQGGKCTFAPIYLKISAMEGEIFWAFLILGTMSIMVQRRIFDKRANYVERFVKSSGYSEFSRLKMYLCTNLSQNLCDGG